MRLCSSAEAGIVLDLFLNFEQNELLVLTKNKKCTLIKLCLQEIG